MNVIENELTSQAVTGAMLLSLLSWLRIVIGRHIASKHLLNVYKFRVHVY